MTMNNPLLNIAGLPDYVLVQPEHVVPAVDHLLANAEQALREVTQPGFNADWTAIARTLDVQTEKLGLAWSVVGHLQAVMDTPELRAAYNGALPKVTDFYTRLGASDDLFAKYQAIDPATLNSQQRRALELALRNFVLGGAQLKGAQKERFAQLQERMAELGQKFSENALDATDAFSYLARNDETAGIPADVLQTARNAAQAQGREGFLLTLKPPCYLPVMQFAQHRPLRETMYRAFVTRASDQADASARRFDNSALISELLALRREEAQLLGFPNFAALSLAPKMADTPEQVVTFLRDLALRARPYAERDLADLREHAARHLNLAHPEAWDWPFIGERLREARYAFSKQEVKTYFPLPRVLDGLFKIVETLFEVSIRPDQAAVWHPAVSFYTIERHGERLGQFYLDPAARTGKRGGAWMDDVRVRWLRPDTGQLQTPVAQLVCNFSEGVDGKPALLTHDDVITVFHEFGHGLHQMLSQVNERDVSGINGVEWDAVELPSQFMENFCWEWDVLRHMSAHVDSGEPLPRELFDKMLAAKNFQSGLQTLRQVELGLFDMLLHIDHSPQDDCMALLRRVRAEVAVLPVPDWARTPNTFSHIFAGGYAAGYYSYKWAEVLSADAYAAFEESRLADGSFDPDTGRRYRQNILEMGGSRPAMESFQAFRGRAPRMDALLRHQGMA